MIQIRNKIGSAVPDILSGKGRSVADAHKVEYENGAIDFKFDPKIYGNKNVKENIL